MENPNRSPLEQSKNPPFTQVYPRGWDTISGLAMNRPALQVYAFIAKHCDHMNALVCTLDLLAEELGLNERTIRRATKWLNDNKHLSVIKIGTANAYILDHRDIWKNYDQYKRYCAFGATTLVSKAQNKDLKTRITMMMTEQPDLFDAETGEVN